jgi:hypothetical protein
MTTNQEERVRHVLGWRQSGLTAVEYSEKAGVPTSSLRYWAYEHDRANRLKPVRLARVERAEKAPSLVIETGDVRIRLERGFDGALLRDAVRALRGGA